MKGKPESNQQTVTFLKVSPIDYQQQDDRNNDSQADHHMLSPVTIFRTARKGPSLCIPLTYCLFGLSSSASLRLTRAGTSSPIPVPARGNLHSKFSLNIAGRSTRIWQAISRVDAMARPFAPAIMDEDFNPYPGVREGSATSFEPLRNFCSRKAISLVVQTRETIRCRPTPLLLAAFLLFPPRSRQLSSEIILKTRQRLLGALFWRFKRRPRGEPCDLPWRE